MNVNVNVNVNININICRLDQKASSCEGEA